MERTKVRVRSLWLAALAIVFAVMAAMAFALPQKALADDSLAAGQIQAQADDEAKATVGWTRLQGDIALDTMASIVDQGWTTSDAVVLTTVDGYWDALTAAGIAGQAKAPVLMTETDSLSTQTKATLAKLKPATIFVVGGTAAVTDDTAKAAAAATGVDTKIVRAAGQDAIGTANSVAAAVSEVEGAAWADNTAFICTNDGYWDALAAAPLAYAKNYPIFLASGHDSVTQATITAMNDAGVKNVFIVGGEAALTPAVNDQLQKAGFSTSRLAGTTAVETSEAVANKGLELGMTANNMGAATMAGYWDALAGAALCGLNNGVLVLVQPEGESDSITNFIAKNADSISTGFIFGGPNAISEGVEAAIKKAAPGVETTTVLTVNVKHGDGTTTTREYSNIELQALASDSSDPQSGMFFKGSAWNVTTAAKYVTLDDLFADMGESASWATGATMSFTASDGFGSNATYDTLYAGKFFGTDDEAAATAVVPVLALTEYADAVGTDTTNDTAAKVQANNVEKANDKNAPRMIYGITADQYKSQDAAGNRYVTNVATINVKDPEASKYVTVTFESNGGSEIASQTIEAGKTLTDTKNITPTKEGYGFSGWYMNNKLKGDPIVPKTQTFDADTTLYAAWGSYFTVSVQDKDGKELKSKEYTKEEFNALASESTDPISAVWSAKGTTKMFTAIQYVTVESLVNDAMDDGSYWTSIPGDSVVEYGAYDTSSTRTAGELKASIYGYDFNKATDAMPAAFGINTSAAATIGEGGDYASVQLGQDGLAAKLKETPQSKNAPQIIFGPKDSTETFTSGMTFLSGCIKLTVKLSA